MKKFTEAEAIGQAGEYLIGSVVAEALGWPYRMQPIADIGVDGEIEVLSANGEATHGLVKVQSKAERGAAGQPPSKIYVAAEDFEYWELLALPVIVCRPVLHARKVYWLPTSKGRRTGGSFAFDFDAAPELSAASAADLRSLSRPKNKTFDVFTGVAAKIERLLAPVISKKKEEHLEDDGTTFYREYDTAVAHVSAAENMATLFPELVTPEGAKALAELRERKGELERTKRWLDSNRA